MKNNTRIFHHTIGGQIIYDPVRGKDRMGQPVINEGRCTIIIKDAKEMTRYYRRQFFLKYGITLLEPSWEPHLTVITNKLYNRNKKMEWKHLDRKLVEVKYSHFMYWNNEHVWVAAESPEVEILRTLYGNPSHDRGHITIGKFKDNDVGRLPNYKKPEDIERWYNYANSPI